ncbi:MAG: sodium-dependent bicarbonate transport family permease, partial [Nitrosarchaeum sp.]|nr:sodium-dependent bicarbonate transport family permease [Nitrosarchaeum sp.]
LASASFIAAPAVLRHTIPQAKPSLYITSALGITFPYNIIVLLPIMFTFSSFIHNSESINLFHHVTNFLT